MLQKFHEDWEKHGIGIPGNGQCNCVPVAQHISLVLANAGHFFTRAHCFSEPYAPESQFKHIYCGNKTIDKINSIN